MPRAVLASWTCCTEMPPSRPSSWISTMRGANCVSAKGYETGTRHACPRQDLIIGLSRASPALSSLDVLQSALRRFDILRSRLRILLHLRDRPLDSPFHEIRARTQRPQFEGRHGEHHVGEV